MTTLLRKTGLFHKLQPLWDRWANAYRPIKPVNPAPDLHSIWEDMLNFNDHMTWNNEETSILLEFEKIKPFCHTRFAGSDDKGQTVLLGFDLKMNQLLVDEFFPLPKPELLRRSFDLVMSAPQGILILHVEIKETVYLESQPALLLQILNKKIVQDRRLNPRVQFSRNTAPKLDLLVPLCGPLKGHLLDLSNTGLTMVVFGPNKPELISNTGECTLYLSEHIKIKARMRIKQINYNRSPSNHTTLRIMFTQPSDSQNDQLSAFIQSFSLQSTRAA